MNTLRNGKLASDKFKIDNKIDTPTDIRLSSGDKRFEMLEIFREFINDINMEISMLKQIVTRSRGEEK